MAKYLLKEQGYSSSDIDTIIKKGKTKEIRLKNKILIYHLYWTAWKENGEIKFVNDIYDYDAKIWKALNAS